jgi:MFS family permease
MVAGMGGGGLNVLGTVILSDLVPLKRRGTFQGYMNIVFASGTSLGAPIGGLVAVWLGWGWSFGIQIPLIILSILVVLFRFHLPDREITVESIREKLKRVDFGGAVTLV